MEKKEKKISNGVNKNSKILIIGFGSIGQRHRKNLQRLGFRNVYVYDIDKERIKNYELRIKNIDVDNLKQFNIIFVCNPNNLHIKTALLAAKAGCHLFIEKPLSNQMKDVNILQRICQRKRLINMVACNMRFHPGPRFIKNYLDKNKLGKVYGIQLQAGYYLPYWRPEQDYRKGYAAKAKTGGGIILDGGIHNFDLLFWLNNFSSVNKAELIYDKISDLQIETEDSFIASFKFKNKVLGSVIGDYLQRSYSWTSKIVGAKGNLEWDFKENIVWLINEKGKKILKQFKNYDSNEMYLDEFRYFMKQVERKQKTFNDIARAAEILKNLR
ncbi:MAG: Gfo/Idh/MocA family oxidoreductase [Patescibacteria group bacterium]|nr:Gfo/Idh/MocA family oxidoreductase [Patescibacteria group bacterium]